MCVDAIQKALSGFLTAVFGSGIYQLLILRNGTSAYHDSLVVEAREHELNRILHHLVFASARPFLTPIFSNYSSLLLVGKEVSLHQSQL
jgi:hypothetical protein